MIQPASALPTKFPNQYDFPSSSPHPGMGQAVAERTVLRRIGDDYGHEDFETWAEVAHRVALGSALLVPNRKEAPGEATALKEYLALRSHISAASVLMSGRHLQHGDATQPDRNMEIFTNCATAPTSFLLFQLLLNGSGVGRCYDDDMMLVNWDDAPTVRCVMADDHPDFDPNAHESARDAIHKYETADDVLWFRVPDSREGWAKALEMWEIAAFERVHRRKLLILDFTDVRCKGSPIAGMQNRPSSGPVPLMNAFAKAMTIRGAGITRWRQNIYIDHYFAECVLVGGARRSARMSTKTWRDKTVLDFIRVKRPVEYKGLGPDEVVALRQQLIRDKESPPLGFLWSSNDSVAVDAEFWKEARKEGTWANEVFEAACACAYADGTGEPGFINVDQLVQNDDGWGDLYLGDYVGSDRYQCEENTHVYLSKLARRAKRKDHHMITNPCGEITLNLLGGYCVLADVVPYHAAPTAMIGRLGRKDDQSSFNRYVKEWDDRAEDAFRVTTRALIRVNLMDSLYKKEVVRTNRIGVSITGIHEYAWMRFGLGFRDLVDENRSKDFWAMLRRFSAAVYEEALSYSALLGLAPPHTMTTMKPAGTTSKLFGLTEGAHLPPHRAFLRWVQFRDDDPLIEKYKSAGYPARILKQYKGHTIVGFPTQPIIATLGMGDKLVLASEATMDEQYKWLRLLEDNWLEGGHVNKTPYGNEISYTLKYDPGQITYEEFKAIMLDNQHRVRCCTVMPQEDEVAYEYQPEESVTEAKYEQLCRAIDEQIVEDVGVEHLDCGNGSCPVEFGKRGEARLESLGTG